MTKKVFEAFRTMGPYVALELFVPGGTLLSILLWYARKRRALAAAQQS
ncbi:MAG TPA: hypothetical protein VHP37_14840 [Burkholderiales bacterium]|jgi:hypothetical protein|nr:hypothetical protein [Burkholderiales bacterium]